MNLRAAFFLSSLCLVSFPVGCGSDSDDDAAGGASATGGAQASGGKTASGGKAQGGSSGATHAGGASGAGGGTGVASGGTAEASAGAAGAAGGAETSSGGDGGASSGGTNSGGTSSHGGAMHASAGASGMGEGGQSEGGAAGSSGTGASAGNAGGEGGGAASLDCTLPSALGAPGIANSNKSGDPPAMTGGTISDGLYFQISEDDYHGQLWEAPNNHRVAVFDQASGKFAEVQANQSGGVYSSFVGRLTVATTTFSVSALECSGTSDTFTMQYTATPTTIAWVDPQHPNRVMNFAKQ